MQATDGEIAEALDVGLSMGGTLATKSVRWAYHVMEEIRAEKSK